MCYRYLCMHEKILKCYKIFSLIKCIGSVVEKKKEKIEVLNSLDFSIMAEIIIFSDKFASFIPKCFLFPHSSCMMTVKCIDH